jgi:heme exporter protein CcmD
VIAGDLGTSVADFFAMGGQGLYIWLSYGAAAGVVAYNVLTVRLRERRWIREYRDRERRVAAAGAAAAAGVKS